MRRLTLSLPIARSSLRGAGEQVLITDPNVLGAVIGGPAAHIASERHRRGHERDVFRHRLQKVANLNECQHPDRQEAIAVRWNLAAHHLESGLRVEAALDEVIALLVGGRGCIPRRKRLFDS
jgi:hypothetical protein